MNSKIKVLHCYRTYFPDPPGGVQEAICQIALATEVHSIATRVFTLSPKPFPAIFERPEGQIIRSKSWLAPSSCDLGGIDAVIKFRESAEWADVIHYHFPWPFSDFLHLLGHSSKPTVMTYHSDIIRQRFLGALYAPVMRRTLRSMSAVVATSPDYANTSSILSSCVSRDRLKIIPLGVADYSDIKIETDREIAFLNKFSIQGKPFVLALGVLRYYKGLHTLMEAAAAIDGTIVIAGSGPEEQALKKLSIEKGIVNVTFVGQVSTEEKIILLRRCTVFVLPSHLRSEAFGMVLVEASMFGKPMVTCEIGSGMSYINIDDETGFAVPPESPEHFSRAVNSLLSNTQLATQMGLAARQRYEQLFSGVALGTAYATLYREVTNVVVLK